MNNCEHFTMVLGKYNKFDIWNNKFTIILVTCTDTDDGREDIDGDSCASAYSSSDFCGQYDDDDFQSNLMCCFCGGGINGKIIITDTYKCQWRNDLSFI